MRARAGAGGRGARPICGGRGCAGCAQRGGGVVDMDDGAVTFKGGTISRTFAVRALRSHVACRKCSCLTLHAAHAGACHVMACHADGGRAQCSAGVLQCTLYVVRCALHAAGVERM